MLKSYLYFAFGKIHPTSDLLEARIVKDDPIEVLNGVQISRKGVNLYNFHFQNEHIEIDLNLGKNENYETPYELGNHRFKR